MDDEAAQKREKKISSFSSLQSNLSGQSTFSHSFYMAHSHIDPAEENKENKKVKK